MKVVCIVQARLSSTRLRNKVLIKLFKKQLIFTLLDRINKAKFIDDLVVATQEMLKKGFLASNILYTSLAHKEKILKKYFKELDIIFEKIRKFENGENIYNYLRVKPSTQNFSRLN